jgi:hypothetical protein
MGLGKQREAQHRIVLYLVATWRRGRRCSARKQVKNDPKKIRH